MKASVKLNEGKSLYSFEDNQEGLETIEELITKEIKKDIPFSLPNTELTGFNFLKMNIQNLEIKDKILLKVINEIAQSLTDEEKKIISFESNNDQIEINDKDKNNCISINDYINKCVHKTLHGKKSTCIFLEGGKNFEFSEEYKSGNYDKKICELKEKNKIYEFICIKSLMISITNYMTELIESYIKFENKEKKINEEKNRCRGDLGEVEEQEEEILKLSNLEDIYIEIYNDFVSKSNICSELEDNFKYSLESFKLKYQMNFTLSELFSDIFWNSIFHNKTLCLLFNDSYSSDDYGDCQIDLKKIMKVIFNTNIPLKHHIVELLGLNQIEKDEKKDLMTLIVDMKNKYHSEIIKSEKEKENIKQSQKIKELKEEENNDNNNNVIKNNNLENEINISSIKLNNNKEFINENKINLITNKKEMKNEENIRCSIITANDISVLKKKKAKNNTPLPALDNRNLGVENNVNKDDIKEKENNDSINDEGVPDLTHKTVDEIINYINDDRIVDKSTKGKKKKKSRKNKKAKK